MDKKALQGCFNEDFGLGVGPGSCGPVSSQRPERCRKEGRYQKSGYEEGNRGRRGMSAVKSRALLSPLEPGVSRAGDTWASQRVCLVNKENMLEAKPSALLYTFITLNSYGLESKGAVLKCTWPLHALGPPSYLGWESHPSFPRKCWHSESGKGLFM